MALELNIQICTSGCSSFLFSELTGAYSTVNTTGWGAPNPEIVDAVSATLEITTPSEITYTFDLYDDFPTTDSTQSYEVTGSVLGMSDSLTDGKYTFVYTVVTEDDESVQTTYSITKQLFTICSVECCVNRMLLDIEDLNCDCNKVAKDKYLEAYTLLLALKHASTCGNEDTVNDLLTTINKLCTSNCKNCK
jgi:hypothetical protein